MKRLLTLLIGGVALGLILRPATALAQSAAPPSNRFSVDVNFSGLRPAAGQQIYERDDTQFSEIARQIATYPAMPSRKAYGVDVTYALLQRLGVAVHVSAARFAYSARLGVQIPSPAFFNAFASDSDSSGTMRRRERSVDMSVTWTFIDGHPWRLKVSAGPTIFRLSQEMVQAIAYSQAFGVSTPTNVVDITGHDVTTTRASGVGGHVAVDFSYFFSPRMGVGVVARGNLGRVTIDEPLTGVAVRPAVGGLQIGTGLRIRF